MNARQLGKLSQHYVLQKKKEWHWGVISSQFFRMISSHLRVHRQIRTLMRLSVACVFKKEVFV